MCQHRKLDARTVFMAPLTSWCLLQLNIIPVDITFRSATERCGVNLSSRRRMTGRPQWTTFRPAIPRLPDHAHRPWRDLASLPSAASETWRKG